MTNPVHDPSFTLIELGSAFLGLAVLARLAARWGLSAIPLYLLAGLAFGNGGIAPMNLSHGFTEMGAEIGVLLLLFMLGLEYTGHELADSLRQGLSAGALDIVLNFTPGVIAGLIMRWPILACVLLGGVTWISSSGIIAKILSELQRLGLPETKTIMSVLVLEDLSMAVYLPLLAVLLIGGSLSKILLSVCIAVVAVGLVLLVAIRLGPAVSKLLSHKSEEIILLTTFGIVLLVAGIAERLQVSAAIGAFLVGIAMSGQLAAQSHKLFAPLRDLFAATFFFFFGLQIDPHSLPTVMVPAIALGIITAITKIATGYIASRITAENKAGRIRAGMALVPRGEFSIVIAGLGTAVEPQLGPLAAAYVLFLAIAGPVLIKLTDRKL